jgi:hypothetical protein
MRSIRRKSLPDGLVVERGEKVLAQAATRAGSAVVATNGALYVPAGEEFWRLPWEQVDWAGWKDGWLHVRRTGGEERHIRLDEAGSVPEVVRDRVTATVVASRHFALPGGGVRIVGRRPARGEGELSWSFVFDAGMDADDPGLQALAEQGLAEFRAQMGL